MNSKRKAGDGVLLHAAAAAAFPPATNGRVFINNASVPEERTMNSFSVMFTAGLIIHSSERLDVTADAT